MQKTKKIFVIAGEKSGDTHSAALINQIKSIKPGIDVKGIGGKSLKEAGVNLLFDYHKVNFIGFSAVIKNLFKLRKAISETVNYIREFKPDVLILTDFPGFNLKIAKTIRKEFKGKIIYYISPQIWAWHKSRIKTIKSCIDRMLVVFPFEVEFYKSEGLNVDFIGHPLLKNIDEFIENTNKIESIKPRIALFPGSRIEEFKRIAPIIFRAVNYLQRDFGAEVTLVKSNNITDDILKEAMQNLSLKLKYTVESLNYITILNSEIVITKFGTTAMECTLIGTPFCSVYRAGLINYLIGKLLVKLDFFTITNILAKKWLSKN